MDSYSGTQAVAGAHAFDIGALQEHLQNRLAGFEGPLQVEQFKGGSPTRPTSS